MNMNRSLGPEFAVDVALLVNIIPEKQLLGYFVGVTSWDMMHFPQIVTTGAKTFHATMNGVVIPQEVTTAAPGVATTSSATLRTDTTAAARTLTAGVVRHAPCGHNLRWELVLGGTTPSITSSIVVVGRP